MKNVPIRKAASRYGLVESDLQPMRGGHFAYVYCFQRAYRNYVLRLTPPNEEIDARAQKSILVWMAYLAAQGASVPAPLPSLNNILVETIPTKEGNWLSVAYTRANGILSEELPIDKWDGPLFQTLGKAIGRFHAITRGYVPPAETNYPEWDTGGNLFNYQIKHELWLKEKQARLLERVHTLPKPAEAFGLIHCDMHFGNFFVDVPEQVITIIDFDDCACGWFIMDVAVLLFDILVLYPGSDKDEYARYFLRNFLKGYLVENDLSPFWLEQIPLFLKLLEINIYDMVAKFFPGDSEEWSLKFMPGRKERISEDLPYVSLDFTSLINEFA
jgi:amicoumacin kinase